MVDVLSNNERTNRYIRRLALAVALLLLSVALTGLAVQVISEQHGARARSLLVDCTTPGPKPAPVTGHACWDRLHDPKATGDAVAVIADDLYCDNRRAQHKLPAVPDPRIPCRDQTDPSVYPGGSS